MIFEDASPGLYDKSSQQQISESMNRMLANQAAAAGDYTNNLIGRRKVYDGIEDGLITEANQYDSDARTTSEIGKAQADVQQGFANSSQQMQRQMASMGVDPSSGAALAAMRQMTAQKALGLAGASNTTRRAIEDGGFQRRMAVGGLGKGLNADITNSQAATGKIGETAMTSLMDANTRKDSAAASAANAAANTANAAANQALASNKFNFDKEQWEWGKTNLTALQRDGSEISREKSRAEIINANANQVNAAASQALAAGRLALDGDKLDFERESDVWGRTNLTKAQQTTADYNNKTADGNIAYNSGMLGARQNEAAGKDIAGIVGGAYTMYKDGTLGKLADFLGSGGGIPATPTTNNNPNGYGMPTASTVNGYTFSGAAAQNPTGFGLDIPAANPMSALTSGVDFADYYN